MIELLIILVLAALNVVLVVVLVRQQNTLFRAAMSRTPGEYRKLEREAQRPVPQHKGIDEATALVLESVTSSSDGYHVMPHGLGGD